MDIPLSGFKSSTPPPPLNSKPKKTYVKLTKKKVTCIFFDYFIIICHGIL